MYMFKVTIQGHVIDSVVSCLVVVRCCMQHFQYHIGVSVLVGFLYLLPVILSQDEHQPALS